MEKKQLRRESRKELKSLEKELKEIQIKLTPMISQFDLPEDEVKNMLWDAVLYEKDIEDEKRRKEGRNRISPKTTVTVPPYKAIDSNVKNQENNIEEKE